MICALIGLKLYRLYFTENRGNVYFQPATEAAHRNSWAELPRYREPSVQACLMFQFGGWFLVWVFCLGFFFPFLKCTWAELVQTQASWVMVQHGGFKLLQEIVLTWEPSGKRSKMGVVRLGSCKSAWYGFSVHWFRNAWLTKSWNRKENDKVYLSKSILIEQLLKCVRCCWVSCLRFKCLITFIHNFSIEKLVSSFHPGFNKIIIT